MLIVMKVGGSLLENIAAIKKTAERVVRRQHQGNKIVLVVSALKGETDNLIDVAKKNFANPFPKAMDLFLATGEQRACALMCMAIAETGGKADPFIAPKLSLITDSSFGDAKVKSIDKEKIIKSLEQGNIVVVAGFQGVDEEFDITTLGRGGSDLTAVIIAIILAADLCELYKDAGGILTADKKIVHTAKKLSKISHEELVELASAGAKVVQSRAALLAMMYQVPLVIRPESEDDESQTKVLKENEMSPIEKMVVASIAGKTDEILASVPGVLDEPGRAAVIFRRLAEAGIEVNLILQDAKKEDHRCQITISVPAAKIDQVREVLSAVAKDIGAGEPFYDENVAIVSVVGIGMKTNLGVAADVFEALAERGINVERTSTSDIKISVVIRKGLVDKAVKALHERFIESGEIEE